MRNSTLGLVAGIALGFAAVFGGFDAFLIVAVLGFIGLVIGAVVDGDVDLSRYVSSGRRGAER